MLIFVLRWCTPKHKFGHTCPLGLGSLDTCSSSTSVMQLASALLTGLRASSTDPHAPSTGISAHKASLHARQLRRHTQHTAWSLGPVSLVFQLSGVLLPV